MSSGNDDSVCIYDCEKGERTKLLQSKKYGVDNIRFVHSGTLSAVCSSRNEFDFSLRYWDLYENKFVRYFKGHISDVKSLDVHPYDDLFLSSSSDKTTFLWDLRKEKPVGRIPARHTPASAFDKQGLIFGVCAGDQKVHLFDSRSFDKGEFVYFDVSRYLADPSHHLSRMIFSPCGKFILLTTNTGQIFTIDSFKGNLVATYSTGGIDHDPIPSFSPDSQYVACGSPTGQVNVFRASSSAEDSIKTASIVARLDGHTTAPRMTLFNPTRTLLASACTSVALWIPRQ